MKNFILKSIAIVCAITFCFSTFLILLGCMEVVKLYVKDVIAFLVSGMWLCLFLLVNVDKI